MKPVQIVGFGIAVLAGAMLGVFGANSSAGSAAMPIVVVVTLVAFIAYIIWNLQGTRASKPAEPAMRERALRFTSSKDHATVYCVRTGFVGKLAGMNVSIDGKLVAQLKSPRFTSVELLPGNHLVEAGFVGGAGAQNRKAALDLMCEAGAIVVLHMSPKMGMTKGQIEIERWTVEAAREKLSTVAMVAPELDWVFAG